MDAIYRYEWKIFRTSRLITNIQKSVGIVNLLIPSSDLHLYKQSNRSNGDNTIQFSCDPDVCRIDASLIFIIVVIE